MFTERLEIVSSKLIETCVKAGRWSPKEGLAALPVQLIAVSKAHPPVSLQEAFDAGLRIFGENRVQEAKDKIPLLPASCRWHFLGHLQRNKIRQALPLFELFHGVDSLQTARDMNRIAEECGLFPRILLEVNVAGESSKFGFSPTQLEEQLDDLATLSRVQIEGLMTIPPPAPDPQQTRKYFSALRLLRDQLTTRSGLALPELSMGMSDDFAVAIEEGATMVRVGSALFGERAGKTWRPATGETLDE